jgi:hypothetical protein
MRLFITILFLTLSTGFVATGDAQAADLEDLDSSSSSKRAPKAKAPKAARTNDQEVVREVVRGFYLKANAGTTAYLAGHANLLSSGTTVALTGGSDFIDRESMSVAWEVSFEQGLHNGLKFEEQGQLLTGGAIGLLCSHLSRPVGTLIAVSVSGFAVAVALC